MCTVGFGDENPLSSNERIYVIICECISAGIYANTLNNVSKMVKTYNKLADEYQEKMSYVG